MNPVRHIGARTLAVVCLLVGLELALRHVWGYGLGMVQEQNEYLGWRMLPGQRAWSRTRSIREDINQVEYRAPRKLEPAVAGDGAAGAWEPLDLAGERRAPLETLGFRDRSWDPPRYDRDGRPIKDRSVFRVAVVGNSYTYGTNVEIEQTWPRVLERELAADCAARGDPRRVLVMNFAVQSYLLEQMARLYERVIRPFQPDLLIVPCLPYEVAPMPPSIDDPDYWPRRWILRSACYAWLHEHVSGAWIPTVPGGFEADLERYCAQIGRRLQKNAFAAENRHYWHMAGERMAGVRALLEREGGRLVLVSLPTLVRVSHPEQPGPGLYWSAWAAGQLDSSGQPAVPHIDPLKRFEDALRAAPAQPRTDGLSHNAPGIDALPPGPPESPQRLFLEDDLNHYAPAGHALLAQCVYAALEPQLASKP